MAEQTSKLRSNHEKVAPRLAELEREVNRLMKEREAMKAAHKETLRKEIDQRDRTLKKMTRDLFSAEDQLKNFEDQVKTLQKELRDRSERMNVMRSEHDQNMEAVLKKSKSDSHQQSGEIQRKDREIAELNRQLNDIKRMKDYMEDEFLQASTPNGSRPSTPKKFETSREATPVSKSPREDTLLIKNSELSFLAKTLRDDNDRIKKEKALLQEKLDKAYKELEPLKNRMAGYDNRVTNLTGTLYSKEKQLKQLAEELAETKAAKLQSSTPDRPRPHEKSMIVELQKAQRQLQAKTKELTALAGEADRLRKEKIKLEEEAKQLNRDKAEKRKLQLFATPRPKPQESPATRKMEDEIKRLEKELQERNLEIRRLKGKHQFRVNDLESSLKRRDKQLKALHDSNLKLKVSHQMLEEQRDRQVSIDEWTESKTELDHASATINQLKQENTRLHEHLKARSNSSSPTFPVTATSPVPLSPLSGSPDYRTHLPTSLLDHRPTSPVSIDEFGSMWSLASNESVLQERVDQLKFDNDELTIKYEEVKDEYSSIRSQYSRLRERYQQLLHKSREIQTTYKQCQSEQLQLERECTRLRQGGGEFDIKREEHLRSQLEMATNSARELQEALKKENESVTELQTLISEKQQEAEELKSILTEKEEQLQRDQVAMAALHRELEVLHQQQQQLNLNAASNTEQPSFQQLEQRNGSSTNELFVDSSSPAVVPTVATSSQTVVTPLDQSSSVVTTRDPNSQAVVTPSSPTVATSSQTVPLDQSSSVVTTCDSSSPAITQHDTSSPVLTPCDLISLVDTPQLTLHDPRSPVIAQHGPSSSTVDSSSQTVITFNDHNSLWQTEQQHTSTPIALLSNSSSQTADIQSAHPIATTTQHDFGSQTTTTHTTAVSATQHDFGSQTTTTHTTAVSATQHDFGSQTTTTHTTAVSATQQNSTSPIASLHLAPTTTQQDSSSSSHSTIPADSSSQTIRSHPTAQQDSSSQTTNTQPATQQESVCSYQQDSSSQTTNTRPATQQDSSSQSVILPSLSFKPTHDDHNLVTPLDHYAASEQNVGNTQLLASLQEIVSKLSTRPKEDEEYRSIQGLIEQLQSLIHEECDYSASGDGANRTSHDGEEIVDGGGVVGSITGDRFQHWLSQYEAERNTLKSQVRDLESRLSMGSRRVMELQGLVGELEGRLATEQSLNLSSVLGDRMIHTPVAATPTLTLQEENRLHTPNPATVLGNHGPGATTNHSADICSPALQKDMSQNPQSTPNIPNPPSTPNIPLGLGQRLKETLSHTKQAVSHRSWSGVEEELAVLESLLAELLHDVPSPDYTPYLPSVKGPQTSSPLRPLSPQLLNAREELSNILQDPATYTHTSPRMNEPYVTSSFPTSPSTTAGSQSHQLDQTPSQFVAAHHNILTSKPMIKPTAAKQTVNNIPLTKTLQHDNADTMRNQLPKADALTKKNDRVFVALFDYDPYSLCSTGHPERELTLHTGDVIAVHGDMDQNGYCKATFGDQCGVVPRSFIEEMELTDSRAEQRLLNQSLSSPTPCPSVVNSEIDMAPLYDSRRTAPASNVSSVSSLSTASIIIKSPPEPPSQFHVERVVIKSGLLMRWKAPQTDVHGRSNGCTVKGYVIQCDGVPTIQIPQPLQTKVLVEGVPTKKPHTLTIATITVEGLSSQPTITRYPGVTMAQALYNYDPRADSPNPNPDLELSFKEGQIITVYGDKMEDGFYQGQLDEKTGVVPSNFVRLISSGDGTMKGSRVSPSGYRRKLFDSSDPVV